MVAGLKTASRSFAKRMRDAINSVTEGPKKGPPARTPTTAATPQKDIDKINRKNKINKALFGVGDTAKNKQKKRERNKMVGAGLGGAAAGSALTAAALQDRSRDKSEKAMADYESRREAVKAKRAKDAEAPAKEVDTDAMSFGKAFNHFRKQRNDKGEMPKTFTWRGNKYTTERKDEQIAKEKMYKGGYKQPKKANMGMLNGKKPRTGSMDYRKGGLFR